jgi:hypothetical protein
MPSMLRNHTGFQLFPLTAGSNDSPPAPAGSPVTFEMRNLPLMVGNLAYYLYGVFVTFRGTFTEGEASNPLKFDRMIEAFLSSVEVRNAWHGTPVSQNHVTGQMLKIIEFVGAGYRYVQRPMAAPTDTGTIERTIWIPLSVGCGEKPHHTAQLALFYKQAQLILNVAPASVMTAITGTSTLTDVTVKATACILPEPEIRLGCGVEWIDYRSASSANQEQILLASFGNVTGLTGTIPDAGALWLGAITNSEMPGSFALPDVTRYTFPWRGQVPITDIGTVQAQQTLAQNDMMPTYDQDLADISGIAGFPFTMGRGWVAGQTHPLAGALAMVFLAEAQNVELTKVQKASGDQSYFLSGPTYAGTNHTLGQHIRSWDDNKRTDAIKQVVDSGLAKAVLGQSANIGWLPKLLNKNDDIRGEKLRYLPWRLVPAQPKKVAPLSGLAKIFGRK